MGELEDQIARLAQHRADQVPGYQAPASLERVRASRLGVWFAVAAAITAVVVAAGAILWSRGDDPAVRTGPAPATEAPAPTTIPPTVPPTSPPTTAGPTAAPCPTEQVDTNPMSGGPSNRTTDSALSNVQIQTSACVDEVAFAFRGSLPDWSVEYRSGPIMLEPKGEPISIEGNAFLVVTFNHADAGRTGYAGPQQLRAGPLSHVTEVRQTQDFEAVLTWVIGLDARLPFGVEERDGQLVVRFPESGNARTSECQDAGAHAAVIVPMGWYAQLQDGTCRAFSATANTPAAVTIHASPGVSASGALGSVQPSSSSNITTADGHAGSCVDGVYTGADPTRQGRVFVCMVPWGDAGTLVVTTNSVPDSEFDVYKAGVQAIVASARYLP